MSFQNFKSEYYCVGGRHGSTTTKIYGDITSKGIKVLIGYYPICKRKKSLTVSDNTIQAGGLTDFFKILGKKGPNVSKKMEKIVLKILEELSQSERTLVPHLRPEALKQIYHHYLK